MLLSLIRMIQGVPGLSAQCQRTVPAQRSRNWPTSASIARTFRALAAGNYNG